MTREFAERWSTAEGSALAVDVAARLISGKTLDDLALDTVSGRKDLRGFSLPPADVIKRSRIRGLEVRELRGVFSLRGVTWSGLDLSYASLPNLRFHDAHLLDCTFERATCPDMRFWGSTIENCVFGSTALRDFVLTPNEAHGSLVIGTRFPKADLRGSTIFATAFVDCDFDAAKLDKVQFEGCSFDRVRFTGRLNELIFESREATGRPDLGPMRDTDFSGAELVDVEFRGVRFQNVTFPDEPGLFTYPTHPAVKRRQIELLRGDPSPLAARLADGVEYLIGYPGREDADGYFRRADADGYGPGVGELLESTLRRAIADVGVQSRP